MARRLIVQTKRGELDSLKRDVRIAFTLTPRESSGSYDPVLAAGMAFSSDAEQSRELEWDRELAFATYETEEHHGKKHCALREDRSPIVSAGKLTFVLNGGRGVRWEQVVPHYASATLSIAHNRVGPRQNISLIKRFSYDRRSAYLPISAWPGVEHWAGSSSDLFLQAYITDEADYDGTILDATNRKSPLLAEPLNCDELPETSALKLTEDADGTIRLVKVDLPDDLARRRDTGSLEQGIETLTRSIDDMRKQFDMVVRSLEDTQQRLCVVEESTRTNQLELRMVQGLLSTTRDEISLLGRKVPEASTLAASLDRTEERLTVTENIAIKTQEEIAALVGVHSELARLESSVRCAQQQISAVDATLGTLFNHRVPATEARASSMDESFDQTQAQVPATRMSSNKHHDRDRLNRGVLAVQDLVDPQGASVGRSQDRQSAKDDREGPCHQRLDALESPGGPMSNIVGSTVDTPPPSPGPGFPKPLSPSLALDEPVASNESLANVRRRVTALDRKVPVIESRIDRLERSLASSERRMPTVEEKVVRLDRLYDRTQDELSALQVSLGTTKDELVELGSRVGDVEMMTDQLADLKGDVQPPAPEVFPSRSLLTSY